MCWRMRCGPSLDTAIRGVHIGGMSTPQAVTANVRRTNRNAFIVIQAIIAVLVVLAVVGDVSTMFGVFLTTLSIAVSAFYMAVRRP